MEINNIGYVNLKGSEVENSEKTKSVTPEQKEVQASANNALGNYGKAFINMSFKGNVQNSPETTSEIKELSDEEFEKYKTKLSEKIENLPDYVKGEANYWLTYLNKTNIFVADKILSDERLFGNENVMKNAGMIIRYADSKEGAEVKIAVINEIILNEKLCDNESVMENAGNIIKGTYYKEEAEAKIAVINEIILNERLFGNENVMKNAGNIIKGTYSKKGAEAKIAVINEIILNEKLCDNESVMENAGNIIKGTYFKEEAEAKIAVINKILSDERLFGNENVMKNAGNIIKGTYSKEGAEAKIAVIDKILSDERLFGNENVMKNAGEMIRSTNYENQVELAKMILTNEKLYNSELVMNNAGDIIASVNSKEQAESSMAAIKNILDKKLYVYNCEKLKRIQENENYKELNSVFKLSILDDMQLLEFSDSDLEKIKNAFLKNAKNISKNTDGNIVGHFENFIKVAKSEEFKDFKANELSYNILDNNAGYQLRATKEIDSTDNPENVSDSEKTKVVLTVTDTNGKITKSRSEVTGDNIKTRYENDDKTVILDGVDVHKNKEGKIVEQDISSEIEIRNDENGEPSTIIHTKESDLLKGAYEVKTYNLKDYPQSMDVLEAINDGTIEGGDTLSSVRKLEDGSISYEQNLSNNDTSTKRNYTLKPDGVSYEYSYHINDENGNSLLSLDRSFTKNDDNTTTTIINGKEYRAIFDEDNKVIKITTDTLDNIQTDNEDDKYFIIYIKEMLNPYEKQSEYAKDKFKNQEDMENQFFDFLKTVPSDQLLVLGNYGIKDINIMEESYGCITNDPHTRTLDTGFSIPTISHEFGHGVDLYKVYDEEGDKFESHISDNQELIDIYHEEINSFKEKYPEMYQQTTRYFSQIGGSASTGLSELVAETNMLLTTYGDNADIVKTRGFHLVEYFPKTIAKVGELLGYNK